MKTRYRFMGLVGSLACLGVGAAYADEQPAPDLLLEDPQSIRVQRRESGLQYSIKSVPPSPMTDYKIGRITPDPAIDYKIMTTGPRPELDPVEIDTGKEELPMNNN